MTQSVLSVQRIPQRILFVDDEPSVLHALERLFFDSDYELLFASSGEAGLKMLSECAVDIVVSDMKMPGMSGHQFLQRVKSSFPGVTRIALSGYANEHEMLESIIDGSHGLYLLKPWDNEELRKIIDKIFQARDLYRSLAMLDFVNKLNNWALLPEIYKTVSRLIDNDAKTTTISKVIESDPAVTASVLRVINSAFYKIRTGSITQAITYLGFNELKLIVLSCSLLNSLQINAFPFSNIRLSLHSSRTNLLAAAIFDKCLEKRIPETVASAGLLHNMGLIFLIHYYPRQYQTMARKYLSREEPCDWSKLEINQFGITHCHFGGYLLDWWGLPHEMVECALFHDTPGHEAIVNRQTVAAVHLASVYAGRVLYPVIQHSLDPLAFEMLGTSRKIFERLLEKEISGGTP